jgi:hypothetical protein
MLKIYLTRLAPLYYSLLSLLGLSNQNLGSEFWLGQIALKFFERQKKAARHAGSVPASSIVLVTRYRMSKNGRDHSMMNVIHESDIT